MAVEQGSTPESPPVEVNPASSPATPDTGAINTDVKPAEPSPAKDESVLARVKAALATKTEGSSPPQASQEAPPNPDAPEGEQEPEGDPTEEELARYHSRTRKRLSNLIAQRNEARNEIEKIKPEAEVGRKITGFLQESGISADEANLLLDIGKNLKQDPLKAWEQIKPFYDALSKMAGEALPDDLAEAVKKGEVSEPYARQIARSRTETSVLSRRTEQQTEAQRQQREADRSRQHGDAVGQAITTWETNQAKADPDWNLKQDLIRSEAELLVRQSGYPATTKQAVEMVEKAKATVEARLAKFAPRRQAITPLNPASATRPVPPAPTTALEAAKQRLAALAG